MNTKVLWTVIAIILAGIVLWLFFGRSRHTQVVNLHSSGTSIVAFGDSLVSGYGSTAGHDFVSLLSARTGTEIINLGRNGDTTEAALGRIDTVFGHDPRIVIVLLGGNDFLRNVPKDSTFANLHQIVTTIQSHGAAVLLLGVRGGLLRDTYADDFRSFAENHSVAFVPNVLEGLIGNPKLMSDQIHPNDAGYARIADKVWPVLQSLLQ